MYQTEKIINSASSIVVDIAQQTLMVYHGQFLSARYLVSTALNGIGQIEDTGCTPLGKHIIAQKIGADLPINSVLKGRVPTGEIYSEAMALQYPTRDWILTRVLWLAGCEQGVNLGCTDAGLNCDTQSRYIYIHGTPDTEPMGIEKSHGCIRMRNTDLIELFEQVQVGTTVDIVARFNQT